MTTALSVYDLSPVYRFGVLDPRQAPVAAEHNDRLLSRQPVLGLEVTIPALAARCCLGNIDPQHGCDTFGRSATPVLGSNNAAITAALGHPLPPDGATLVTVRPDLDSIGAMAVLLIRAAGLDGDLGWIDRVRLIEDVDAFAQGPWVERPLPTLEQPYLDHGTSAVAAMAAAVADHRVPVDVRVNWMAHWLLTGEEPETYRLKADTEAMAILESLDRGETVLHAYPRASVVFSSNRGAIGLGYRLNPVVVAINDNFSFNGGEPHRKVTIAQWDDTHVDLRAIVARLNVLEPGWGGSTTICGSPQGESSRVTDAQILAIISEHLR